MKQQATKIVQNEAPRISEPVGCLGVLLLFIAMIGTVYATPYVVAWIVGVI